jgi:glutathione S-transferase
VITTPEGELIWDSTAIIVHLDHCYRKQPVLPPQPELQFLAYLLDDFSDEWLYRHAVGSRWLYEENRRSGSWDIAREGALEFPGNVSTTQAVASAAMIACLPRLGTTPENIDAWIDESLLPWQRALAAHVGPHGYLLGRRPSLADFALFGGNAAHFINDPVCCRWMEEQAPAVVDYTHTMLAPQHREYGDWLAIEEMPATLIALLAETGRHYLPWVSAATRTGRAVAQLGPHSVEIATTNFLDVARGTLLAHYVRARTPALDAILERAGILQYFADYTDQATHIGDPATPPRPTDNQPFPSGP